MKVMRVLSAAALLVALTASMAFAHNTSSGRLERREMGRSGRAWQGQGFGQRHGQYGQRWGQLTRWEAARLRLGQAQIARMERLARADGIVTFRERRMIQRAKMEQMQLMYRFRHNGRTA